METFTWTPDYSSNKKKKPEVNTIPFGDGYSQRIATGANKLREEYSLTFSGSYAKIKAIDEFLDDRDGNEDFEWATLSGVTKIFYCEDWNADFSTYNNYTLTATFKQR